MDSGLGMVKHGFQSMLVLFLKRDTYPYEMDNKRSLENLGGTDEGAVMVYKGRALAEGDERVEGPIVEFIPEESEDPNDISSGEDAWLDPVTEEVEEEEEVEFPLPTMGVPPLEENDEPYPESWIGEMDMDVVVMADTPLLYDQDSQRSEAIWHGEDPGCLECAEHFQTLHHWLMDERMLPYIEAAGFSALYRVQWLRLDKPLITSLVDR
ncbi:hypothetical protein H6P81_003336 [Aristolochia fimbriata]|uniref:Uncharacterized protein n=1 Tax=Aristolochia fimbriata TaxID=158543 RepID=A0AAV7FCH0_ARIFI|nr:hypothetical protein H6P81_003336 [Aristolochia fimbriata]